MNLLNMANVALLSEQLKSKIYAKRGSDFSITCENLRKVKEYPILLGNENTKKSDTRLENQLSFLVPLHPLMK